jgi:AcrR family transcriptional regulator
MKDQILEAATKVLVQHGLNGWTVDEVARKAGCAKGLVNYHHRSKQQLLERVAERLRDDRWARRVAKASGPTPLDTLWQTLIDDADSGRFSAWLSLLSGEDRTRKAVGTPERQAESFCRALGQSLGLGDQLTSHAGLIAAILDGITLRLLEGVDPASLEEGYHRFWLTLLDM